jgi:hypothetical protein
LLFQVELIIGKSLLPWFGGAPATWITCLFFFQSALLIGYAYAHALIRSQPQSQARVHITLCLLSILLLTITAIVWRTPIMPGQSWKPIQISHPIWQLFKLLNVSVGFPFLLLSATTPLVQSWFSRVRPQQSAYPLYALSNLGSLLALLSYPVLIEPHSTLFTQGWVWSTAYLLFVITCIGCALTVFRSSPEIERPSLIPVSRFSYVLWGSLAACGSALLLAVTNMVCQEIAVVPLLWVAPLALYLLSFVACFARRPIYFRWLFHPLFALSSILVLIANRGSLFVEISAYLFMLFVACVCCHGELARLKPPSSQSTAFYLAIATGGALGSVFVSLIAPQVFTGLWEFPVAMIASGMVVTAALFADRESWLYQSPAWLPVLLVWAVILSFRATGNFFDVAPQWSALQFLWMLALSLVILRLLWRRSDRLLWGWFRPVQFFVVAFLGLLTYLSVEQMGTFFNGSLYASRNFFGILRVMPGFGLNELSHGRTLHGSQFTDPKRKYNPTLYYLPGSGIATILTEYPNAVPGTMRVGVIGLGAGTIAAFAGPGDTYVFYEINPSVKKISADAGAIFTFVPDAPANTKVRVGDARLLMEAELARGERQNFDVLALDAFNSDAIPVHLLTREAVALYLEHLRPGGVLAFHISNRTLDLAPVLTGIMNEFHLQCADVDFNETGKQSSRWVLLSRHKESLQTPTLLKKALYGPPSQRSELWTDDYSNLLHLLKTPE